MGMTDTTIMIVTTQRADRTIIGTMKIITKIGETIDPSSPRFSRDSTMTMRGSTMPMIWRKREMKTYSDRQGEIDAPRRRAKRLVFTIYDVIFVGLYLFSFFDDIFLISKTLPTCTS